MGSEDQSSLMHEKIASCSFFLYFFFVFFGTSLPFQPPVSEIDEKTTSNVLNQVIFSSLFLASMFALWPKRFKALELMKAEKWLFVFLAWCLFSLMWSDYPFVSFKRLFQIVTTVVICLSALLWKDSSFDLIEPIRKILYVYIILSLLSVFFIAGAVDPKTLTWRGLAPSKNHLGQAAMMSFFLFCAGLTTVNWRKRLADSFMLILCMILLFGARSLTAIMVFTLIVGLWFVLKADKRLATLGIGHFFFFFVLGCAMLLGLVLVQFPGEIEEVFQFLGKDLSFTGRTELWVAVLGYAQQHVLLGSGFCGFWVAAGFTAHQ